MLGLWLAVRYVIQRRYQLELPSFYRFLREQRQQDEREYNIIISETRRSFRILWLLTLVGLAFLPQIPSVIRDLCLASVMGLFNWRRWAWLIS